ncbi:MAG: NAD(P)/FAD-dependent oxidoreductase [Clostridia bacterium]|nr:NAD(P)/FAD-dependent oxidoreductase [Clostridia bacterium]
MKKIVVAGAGIGGLVAAINLAKKGFDITIYESKDRSELGHDWCDTVYKPSFPEAGIPLPTPEHFTPYRVMSCRGPKKNIKVVAKRSDRIFEEVAYIDRKFLAEYLADLAEKNGVKFIFGVRVLSPVIENGFVTGLKVLLYGKEKEIRADLVIDAAGIDSPVRKNLPKSFGIENEVKAEETLFTYRAYFARKSDEVTDPRYNTYFYHCRRASIDWVITEDEHIDVLVTGFGSLTKSAIEAAVADFQKDYPYIDTDKILRGGTTSRIPLRKSLPLFVGNGYAAVGDSAIMIEPLSGSGVRLSFGGGKILADTVTEIDGKYSLEKLWKYQYRYFKECGEDQISVDIIKSVLTSIDADDMDYLFETEVLGAKEFAETGSAKYTANELLQKVAAIAKRPKLLKPLANAGMSIINSTLACNAMPENYSVQAVENWIKLYKKI